MAEISIIELIVYGLIGYPAIIFLVASSFRDHMPDEKNQSVIRAIWIIAPIICMYMLASAGAQINFETVTSTLVNVNSTETWTETVNHEVMLVNPVWVLLHYLFFIMLILYFLWNMFQLFTKVK